MEKIEFLSTCGIIQQAFLVPLRNPRFVIITFLASLPLLFTMHIYETILSGTLKEIAFCIRDFPPYVFSFSHGPPVEAMITLVETISYKILQLGLFRFVPLHLLYLLNTIVTLEYASAIYAGETYLIRQLSKTRISGAFITSTYILFLQLFSLILLIWVIFIYVLTSYTFVFMFIYGIILVVGIGRWLDICAIWNMSVVISVLEERSGVDALVFSAYFNRGSRRRGFILMLGFFTCWVASKILWFYVGEKETSVGVVGKVAYLYFVFAGNVMKWVVCMIYFYDCKNRVVEKMIDLESTEFDVGSLLDGSVVLFIRVVSNIIFL